MLAPATIQQSSARLPPAPAPLSMRAAGPVACCAERAASAVDLLLARFPAVRRLVGDESFRVMAGRYMLSELARASSRTDYGDTFPKFLRSQGNLASFEYVADIAELEVARDKARRAADAPPAGAQTIRALRSERLAVLHVMLHPSVFLVASRFPIVTIWERNQRDGEDAMIERWRPEAALIARPLREIEVRRLPAGGHAFLGALSAGRSVSAAADAAKAAAPDFDLGASLALVIDADIVTGFREQAAMNISRRRRRIAS